MNIGILDCKLRGSYIEEVERYQEEGFSVINAGALDKPRRAFDILASTWTLLSEKRLKNVGCRGVVVKDNDEPWNVIKTETIQKLSLPIKLIADWGVSTRVAWNCAQISQFAPDAKRVAIIADTPSHRTLTDVLLKEGLAVLLGKDALDSVSDADVIIVHLGKKDFTRYWFDQFLASLKGTTLLISTTRGPLFSAEALNSAIAKGALKHAVLDWAWQEHLLLSDERITLTNHSSYRSAESKRELTQVTIAAVKELAASL